jgi:hypothetical protein
MDTVETLLVGKREQQVLRGVVVSLDSDEPLVGVRCELEGGLEFACEILHGSEEPLSLACGDSVLLWHGGREGSPGVILGRIGPSHARPEPTEPNHEVPDVLEIEATKNLTLRCGDGSISIRADGKILIKGRDLVSHAKRINRIKGGSVSIN